MQFTTIEVQHVNGRTRETWRASLFDDTKLVLAHYSQEELPPRAHKWRVLAFYDRLNTRESRIPLDQVPWDAALQEEIKNKFVSMLTVNKTYMRGNCGW